MASKEVLIQEEKGVKRIQSFRIKRFNKATNNKKNKIKQNNRIINNLKIFHRKNRNFPQFYYGINIAHWI